MGSVAELDDEVELFAQNLRRGKVTSSYQIADETVNLLKKLVTVSNWDTAEDLMVNVKNVGIKLIEAQPTENCVGNMVRRVLKIIREEYLSAGGKQLGDQESLQKMVLAHSQSVTDYRKLVPDLKTSILESISELLTELENSAENISQQAAEHIHANEVIMTVGNSKTVEAFLKRVAKKRKFHVIVAESAPSYQGHEMAVSLANENIETTLITDSAVFAMMSRVNKVIIGTHSVMANGGLKAISGTHALALAAQHYSVPLIVCAAMFKLSPQYLCSHDQDAFNKFVSPHDVLNFSEGAILSKVHVFNPVFDYVPPEDVTLFISNIGGNSPSYVYRLLSELYDPCDYELSS